MTMSEVEGELDHITQGKGRIDLRSSAHDPLEELEITDITGAVYSTGASRPRARAIGTIPGSEFLPYALARVDDYSLLVSQND